MAPALGPGLVVRGHPARTRPPPSARGSSSSLVHPARARVHAEFFRTERAASGATVERDEIRVRTVFALRFGHVRTDDGEHISQDAVRAAFNSPFRPFVLTSTSIGQERLNFHPWCHRLVHWNLPGDPVDLEQR